MIIKLKNGQNLRCDTMRQTYAANEGETDAKELRTTFVFRESEENTLDNLQNFFSEDNISEIAVVRKEKPEFKQNFSELLSIFLVMNDYETKFDVMLR